MFDETMMGFAADGLRILLRESFDKAVLAGSVYFRDGLQWFPLAPHSQMEGIRGWVGSEAFRDSDGEFHLPLQTMSALMGMEAQILRHRLLTEPDFSFKPREERG